MTREKEIKKAAFEYADAVITEDYCSFEISKLLKEKGFDGWCDWFYDDPRRQELRTKDGEDKYWNGHLWDDEYAAPTHQMAMKWLREVHNIIIAIRPPYNWNGKKPTNYLFDVWHYCDDNTDINISVVSSTIYEEAVEAALKYSLENLI